jgi:hypothetical protein
MTSSRPRLITRVNVAVTGPLAVPEPCISPGNYYRSPGLSDLGSASQKFRPNIKRREKLGMAFEGKALPCYACRYLA